MRSSLSSLSTLPIPTVAGSPASSLPSCKSKVQSPKGKVQGSKSAIRNPQSKGGETRMEESLTGTDSGTEDGRLVEAEAKLDTAIRRYRELVASGPDLIPELVQGNTVEDIDASVQAARQAY